MVTIPQPPSNVPDAVRAYLTNLVKALDQNDRDNLKANRGNGSFLLISPNGSVWELTVDDAGALATTKIAG